VAALDGIRGLAILLVLLFHFTVFGHMTADTLGERAYRGLMIAGWSGVDLFFVLSGFLITGILVDARDGEHYFRNFYARRFLRIFPLYYVALVLLLWGVPALIPGLASPGTGGDALWYGAYVSNVRAATEGWSNTLVDHFWSLAVEEQFYLAWPLVIFFARPGTVPLVCGALLLLAPALRTALVMHGADMAAYTLTPCRADALAAGGLVACLVRSEVPRARIAKASGVVLAFAAVALAFVCVWRHGLHSSDRVVSTLGYSLNAVMFAALVAATYVAPGDGALKRAFGWRPLRVLGKYSYGIYVFHQPVAALIERAGIEIGALPRVFGSHVPAGVAVLVAGGGLTFLVAFASWNLYEARLIKLKAYFEYTPRTRASDGARGDGRGDSRSGAADAQAQDRAGHFG
jgi:peptidoglycan/LPS O-acetylase OafA/YrhL